MEIEVGEYVRTKNGHIAKIKQITIEPQVDIGIGLMPEVVALWTDNKHESAYDEYFDKKDIVKHSKNIIDLIQVGDFVNGKRINDIIGNLDIKKHLENVEIKSILTKEQYEQNSYKF